MAQPAAVGRNPNPRWVRLDPYDDSLTNAFNVINNFDLSTVGGLSDVDLLSTLDSLRRLRGFYIQGIRNLAAMRDALRREFVNRNMHYRQDHEVVITSPPASPAQSDNGDDDIDPFYHPDFPEGYFSPPIVSLPFLVYRLRLAQVEQTTRLEVRFIGAHSLANDIAHIFTFRLRGIDLPNEDELPFGNPAGYRVLDFLTDAMNDFIIRTWDLFMGRDPFHSYAMSVSCLFVRYNYFNFRWWLRPFEGIEVPTVFSPALSILDSDGVIVIENDSFFYLIVSPQQAIRMSNIVVNRINTYHGGDSISLIRTSDLRLRADLVQGSDLILSSEGEQLIEDLYPGWRLRAQQQRRDAQPGDMGINEGDTPTYGSPVNILEVSSVSDVDETYQNLIEQVELYSDPGEGKVKVFGEELGVFSVVNTKVGEKACFYVSMSLLIDPPESEMVAQQIELDFYNYHRWYKWENYHAMLTHGQLDRNRGVSINDIERVIEPILDNLGIFLKIYSRKRTILYQNNLEITADTKCCALFFHERHFSPIRDLSLFLRGYDSTCVKCKTRAYLTHVCFYACYKCGKRGGVHKRRHDGYEKMCEQCDDSFYADDCYEMHKTKLVAFTLNKRQRNMTYCEYRRRCRYCKSLVDNENIHECKFFCWRCRETGNELVSYPVFNFGIFLNVLSDEDREFLYDNDGDVFDKRQLIKRRYNEFLNEYEFHQCKVKFNESALAHYMIIYDIETYRSEQGILKAYMVAWTLRCQTCIYEDQRCLDHSLETFHVIGDNCLSEFIDAILEPLFIPSGNDVMVFAHNGGKFDHLFFTTELNKRGFCCQYLADGPNSLISVDFIDRNRKYSLRCTYKFFQTSLQSLAETCGLEDKGYFPMEFIPDKLDRIYGPGQMPEIDDFCVHHPELVTCDKFLRWYEETKIVGFGNVREKLIEYCELDVTLLADIVKTLSLYIYRKIAPVKVLFAYDIRTLAKCSMYMWSYFNYIDNDDVICLYGIPVNYRYEWMWTSNYNKIILSSLRVNDLLEFHDPCTNVFFSSENNECGYMLLDCTHFACPKTQQYDVFYAFNEKIRLANIEIERDRFVTRLERIYGRTIRCIYNCEIEQMLRTGKFENGENIYKQDFLELYYPHILYDHLPIESEKMVKGGRVDGFSTGFDLDEDLELDSDEKVGDVTDAYKLDVVSLYPYVNMEKNYGVGKWRWKRCETCDDGELDELKNFFNDDSITCESGEDGDLRERKIPPSIVICSILPPRNRRLFVPVIPLRLKNGLSFPLCRKCSFFCDSDFCDHEEAERTLYGNWCDTEIKFACDHGYKVMKIYAIVIWENTCKLARRYFSVLKRLKLLCSKLPSHVKTDDEKRVFFDELSRLENIELDYREQRTDLTLRFIVKLLLNSLWGRFVLNLFEKIKMEMMDVERAKRIIRNTCRYRIVDVRQIDEQDKYVILRYADRATKASSLYQIQFGAKTTTEARLHMIKAIYKLRLCSLTCKFRDRDDDDDEISIFNSSCRLHQIHYMDTDSLKLTCEKGMDVRDFLDVGKAFGQFDNEETPGYRFSKMIILGPKFYMESEKKREGNDKRHSLKAKGLIKGTLPNNEETYDRLTGLVQASTQENQVQLLIANKKPELQRKNGLIYVELDETGLPMISRKSMGLTCHKRFLPNETDGFIYRSTFPFGWISNTDW